MKEPKIRFKGFQREWESYCLNDICSRYDNLRVPIKESKRIPGDIPYYGANGIQDYVTGYTHDGEYILIAEDGASDLDHYPVQYINGKVWVNNHAHVLQGNPDFASTLFLKYAISCLDIKNILVGGSRSKLNSAALMGLNVNLTSIEEQRAIASYFQHLDTLIQSTTKKIESLKQVKAASLQSMFPQEGETTPRVRFKGFEGEWSICPLKYFAKKSTEKNISMDYTITLTNSAEYGVINQRDFFDHDISNDDHINGYYVIHHDDFVYNPRVSTAAPVGPISRNRLGYSGVMSPLYLIFRVNGINKDFLSYYFKTMLWHNYMKLEGNTGARFDRLTISDEQFFNMPICVPRDEKEQTVIASFFTTLDRQITLHTQRLEKLKQIKAACLDKMFV